jgi:hypothetical protein
LWMHLGAAIRKLNEYRQSHQPTPDEPTSKTIVYWAPV